MRYFLFTCICSCFLLNALGQNNTDTTLKFDQRFTQCELRWVVMPKKDTATRYFYGYVYVDLTAGFTLDLKGYFTIDANGRYVADTSMTKNKSFKYRLGPNTPNIALLPPKHFAELHISQRPRWVDIYYRGLNDTSVSYNYHMGFNYNAAGDSKTALTYLDKAYKVNPHYKGLEFEVAYAYNALNQSDDAIRILEEAVRYDTKNILYYRELGYAYSHKNQPDKSILYYKQGIGLYPDTQNDTKAEMAFNLANVYKKTGNDTEYKNWMGKAKGWAAPNSNLYKYIVSQGF